MVLDQFQTFAASHAVVNNGNIFIRMTRNGNLFTLLDFHHILWFLIFGSSWADPFIWASDLI